MSRTIYIAGPMTGYPDNNFHAFDRARDFINARGDEAVSPADLDRQLGYCNKSRGYAQRDTTMIIQHCHGIYLLNGWERSTGAAGEFFLTRWLSISEPDFTFETEQGIVSKNELLHRFALAHCMMKGQHGK